MASYYIIENGQQSGPYTVDQLSSIGITPNTSVWTDGMSAWQPASQVSELQDVIQQGYSNQPGYYDGGYASYGYDSGFQGGYPMPDSHKTKAIWSLVLSCICCTNCFGMICLIFAILALVAANRVSSDYAVGNYHGAMNSSNDANKWANWSITLLIIGCVFGIIAYTLYFFLVLSAEMAGGSYY